MGKYDRKKKAASAVASAPYEKKNPNKEKKKKKPIRKSIWTKSSLSNNKKQQKQKKKDDSDSDYTEGDDNTNDDDSINSDGGGSEVVSPKKKKVDKKVSASDGSPNGMQITKGTRFSYTFTVQEKSTTKTGSFVSVPNREGGDYTFKYDGDSTEHTIPQSKLHKFKLLGSGGGGNVDSDEEEEKKQYTKPETVNLNYSWKERKQQLKEFEAEFNHINVPLNYEEHGLGRFISKKREAYRKKYNVDARGNKLKKKPNYTTRSGLTDEQEKWLTEHDLIWHPGRGSSINQRKAAEVKINKRWMEMYENLVAYKDEGDDTPMDQSLRKWCTAQRAAYRKTYEGKEYDYRVGTMNEERKKLLEKIGFVWNPAGNNNQHTVKKKRRKVVTDTNETQLTSEHMKAMLRDTSDIVQQDVPHLAAWPREDTEEGEFNMSGVCSALQELPTERLLARPCIGDDGGLAPELLSLWGRNMCKITGKPGTQLPFRMRVEKEDEEEALEENIWQVKRPPQFQLPIVGPFHNVSNFGEYYSQEERSGAFAIPFSLDPNQGGDYDDDGWIVAEEDNDKTDDDASEVGGRKKLARRNTEENEEEGTDDDEKDEDMRRPKSPADSEPEFGGNGGDIDFGVDDDKLPADDDAGLSGRRSNSGELETFGLEDDTTEASTSSGGDTDQELDELLATLDEGTMPSSNWDAPVEERLRRHRVSSSSTKRRRQSRGNNIRHRRGSSSTNNRRSSGSNISNQHQQSSGYGEDDDASARSEREHGEEEQQSKQQQPPDTHDVSKSTNNTDESEEEEDNNNEVPLASQDERNISSTMQKASHTLQLYEIVKEGASKHSSVDGINELRHEFYTHVKPWVVRQVSKLKDSGLSVVKELVDGFEKAINNWEMSDCDEDDATLYTGVCRGIIEQALATLV